MAERHRWQHTLTHLREIETRLASWLRTDERLEQMTPVLQRVMSEVKRHVDPVGAR